MEEQKYEWQKPELLLGTTISSKMITKKNLSNCLSLQPKSSQWNKELNPTNWSQDSEHERYKTTASQQNNFLPNGYANLWNCMFLQISMQFLLQDWHHSPPDNQSYTSQKVSKKRDGTMFGLKHSLAI